MRALVASDLHGDFEAALGLLRRFALERADKIFLLGDLLGGRIGAGIDARRTASTLGVLSDKITAVRGNCDSAYDERALPFALPQYVLTEIGACRVLLTHGHLYGEGRLPTNELPDLICEGHTHIARLARRNGYVYLNPGSASCPRGGSGAGYAIVDERGLALKTMDGETIEYLDWQE